MKLNHGPYSPSRLDRAVCRYAFGRQYIDKDPSVRDVETLPQARGSAVHEVLGHLTEEMLKEKKTFKDDEIRSLVARSITAHPAAVQETREIFRMARAYLFNPPNPLYSDAVVEQALAVKMVGGSFQKCDYDDPDAFARGRIDIMMTADGDPTKAIVYDHKTQPNMEEADTFQLGFYAWLVFKTDLFVDEVQTILHFARYGKYSKPYVWRREELTEIEDEILTRIEVNESRTDRTATPNKHCQYCPYMAECPALAPYLEYDSKGQLKPKKGVIKILGNTDKAVDILGVLYVLENLSKEMKKELRAHVEASESPVAIPGVIFGPEVKADEIDVDHLNKHQRPEVFEIFEKHKVDVRHFMVFSTPVLRKLWQAENPRLLAELSAVLKRQSSTEFRMRKC